MARGEERGRSGGSNRCAATDARDVTVGGITGGRGDYWGEREVCGDNRDVSDDRARMLEYEPDGNGVGAGQGVVGDVVVGLERVIEDAGGGDDDARVLVEAMRTPAVAATALSSPVAATCSNVRWSGMELEWGWEPETDQGSALTRDAQSVGRGEGVYRRRRWKRSWRWHWRQLR